MHTGGDDDACRLLAAWEIPPPLRFLGELGRSAQQISDLFSGDIGGLFGNVIMFPNGRSRCFFPGSSALFSVTPENLIVNYGEANRQSDYPTVKQESHPPPKKPLPMNPLASPVTEWGAPGAYTRSQVLDPHNVPN